MEFQKPCKESNAKNPKRERGREGANKIDTPQYITQTDNIDYYQTIQKQFIFSIRIAAAAAAAKTERTNSIQMCTKLMFRHATFRTHTLIHSRTHTHILFATVIRIVREYIELISMHACTLIERQFNTISIILCAFCIIRWFCCYFFIELCE